MATIIDFRSEATRTGSAAGLAGKAGPAEIVLFPGVRYERACGSSKERPRAGKSRRREPNDLDD